jgi:pimeloyl-ACP methyl ester carboxylesterase
MSPLKPRLAFFDRLHWLAERAFKQAGYHWEERRLGDQVIGLWRRRFGAPKPAARRFVVIPGFGDTPISWLPVIALLRPVLRRQFDEVIFVDFPAFHGTLRRERGFDSLDAMFAATHEVLDALKPHTILGHSLGGWVTADYAVRCGRGERPARPVAYGYRGPERVLLASPAGIFGTEDEKRAWRERFELGVKDGFESFRPHMFGKEPLYFRLLAPEFADFFRREEIVAFMGSVRDDHELRAHLREVRAEVRLIWGEDDTLSPARWAEDWMRALPEGRTRAVMLPRIGHSLQLENAAVVAAVVGQLLLGQDPHALGARWWRRLEMPA